MSSTALRSPGGRPRRRPTSSTMPVNMAQPSARAGRAGAGTALGATGCFGGRGERGLRRALDDGARQTASRPAGSQRRRQGQALGDGRRRRQRDQVGRSATDDERRHEQEEAIDQPLGEQFAGQRRPALEKDLEQAASGEHRKAVAQIARRARARRRGDPNGGRASERGDLGEEDVGTSRAVVKTQRLGRQLAAATDDHAHGVAALGAHGELGVVAAHGAGADHHRVDRGAQLVHPAAALRHEIQRASPPAAATLPSSDTAAL